MTSTLNLKDWAKFNKIPYKKAWYLFQKGKILESYQDINSKLIFVGYENDLYIRCRFSDVLYYRDSFYKKDDISSYILGAYITDGNIFGSTCRITSKDKDWLESIALHIGKNVPIIKIQKIYYALSIYSAEIAKWFKYNNCIENKTLIVEFPEKISDESIPDFIRGVIDGDGSIHLGKNMKSSSVSIASASIKFIYSLQAKMFMNNITGSVYLRKPIKPHLFNGKLISTKNNLYTLTIKGQNCFKLLKWVYYNDHKISLDRKNLRAQKIIYFYENLSIIDGRKVSRLGKGAKIVYPNNYDLENSINEIGISAVAKLLKISKRSLELHLERRDIKYTKEIIKARINWPDDADLIQLIKNNSCNYGLISYILKTSRIQLRRYLKKRGIYKKDKKY